MSNCIMAMSNKSFRMTVCLVTAIIRKKGVLLILFAKYAQTPEIQALDNIFIGVVRHNQR